MKNFFNFLEKFEFETFKGSLDGHIHSLLVGELEELEEKSSEVQIQKVEVLAHSHSNIVNRPFISKRHSGFKRVSIVNAQEPENEDIPDIENVTAVKTILNRTRKKAMTQRILQRLKDSDSPNQGMTTVVGLGRRIIPRKSIKIEESSEGNEFRFSILSSLAKNEKGGRKKSVMNTVLKKKTLFSLEFDVLDQLEKSGK